MIDNFWRKDYWDKTDVLVNDWAKDNKAKVESITLILGICSNVCIFATLIPKFQRSIALILIICMLSLLTARTLAFQRKHKIGRVTLRNVLIWIIITALFIFRLLIIL